MSRFLATFGYVGLIPVAPGTMGSLAALPLAYLVHRFAGFPAFAALTVLVFFIGWWAVVDATRGRDDHDPGEIVIDEVVGQWLALWPLSGGLWAMGIDPAVFPYPGWIGGFIMFRLFDIWKPWPVSWADRKETPLGVMLDDVLAGIMAAVVVSIAAAISHGLLR